MNNKPYLSKRYIRFTDFMSASISHELESIILNAEYTRAFSLRLKDIIEELEGSKRSLASISVMFNTEGDIAIIDSSLVGRYIAHRYSTIIREYYKSSSMDRLYQLISEGSARSVLDFFSISYDILYECLNDTYKEIRFNKEVLNKFKNRYNIQYNREDSGIVVNVLMVVDDMLKYMNIDETVMLNIIDIKLRKKYSQFI